MRIVDTSAWIEYLLDSPIATQLAPCMPEPSDCVVPTIVQLELAKWAIRQRGPDEADKILAMTSDCVITDLDTAIAAWAAEICHRHKLATADAVIYATALTLGCDLLTCDAHFHGLEHVVYVPKA